MQLVAYGAQDIYLTGNPQITFFKVVYRRHTNFSMESIEQTFNGTPDFGRKVVCTISRNGDLIHRVYLQVELPSVKSEASDYFRWVNWVGHALIKNVEVEIGGQRIDKHYGDWLHIWNELTQTAGKQRGYASMVGNVDRLFRPVSNNTSAGANTGTSPQEVAAQQGVMPRTTLFIPLQFWFCRNPGLALPLIALQYHEVKINLEFRTRAECCGDESVSSTNQKIKLNFNHPCKELIWVVQLDACVNSNAPSTSSPSVSAKVNGRQWFNYTDRVDPTPYAQSDPLALADIMDGVIDTEPEGGVEVSKENVANHVDLHRKQNVTCSV